MSNTSKQHGIVSKLKTQLRGLLCSIYSSYQELGKWLQNQHPNVVSFISTFLGVFLAAMVAWYVNTADNNKDAKNLLKVMYYDCSASLFETDAVRNSIRNNFGLKEDGDDILRDLAKSNNLELKNGAIASETIYISLSNKGLALEYDSTVIDGVPLPVTMLNALENNIEHYASMHEYSYSEILRSLPSITGLHGGYMSLRRQAESILMNNASQIKSNEALVSIASKTNEEEVRFAKAMNTISEEYKKRLSKYALRSISSLDSYRNQLLKVCYHLQQEWKYRECGISEHEFLDSFNSETKQVNDTLSCGN